MSKTAMMDYLVVDVYPIAVPLTLNSPGSKNSFSKFPCTLGSKVMTIRNT